MSDKDINKAMKESIANVEVEDNSYTNEELIEIRNTIKENKTNNNLLTKLIKIHSEKIIGDEIDRQQK